MVKLPTIRGWLAFEDQATDETKAAVKEGKLGQRRRPSRAHQGPGRAAHEARRAAVGARSEDPRRARREDHSRREAQRRAHRQEGPGQAARARPGDVARLAVGEDDRVLGGREEALKLVIGDKDVSERLLKELKESQTAAKAEK